MSSSSSSSGFLFPGSVRSHQHHPAFNNNHNYDEYGGDSGKANNNMTPIENPLLFRQPPSSTTTTTSPSNRTMNYDNSNNEVDMYEYHRVMKMNHHHDPLTSIPLNRFGANPSGSVIRNRKQNRNNDNSALINKQPISILHSTTKNDDIENAPKLKNAHQQRSAVPLPPLISLSAGTDAWDPLDTVPIDRSNGISTTKNTIRTPTSSASSLIVPMKTTAAVTTALTTASTTWVLVIGGQEYEEILREMRAYGTVVDYRCAGTSGNWIAVQYSSDLEAEKALCHKKIKLLLRGNHESFVSRHYPSFHYYSTHRLLPDDPDMNMILQSSKALPSSTSWNHDNGDKKDIPNIWDTIMTQPSSSLEKDHQPSRNGENDINNDDLTDATIYAKEGMNNSLRQSRKVNRRDQAYHKSICIRFFKWFLDLPDDVID